MQSRTSDTKANKAFDYKRDREEQKRAQSDTPEKEIKITSTSPPMSFQKVLKDTGLDVGQSKQQLQSLNTNQRRLLMQLQRKRSQQMRVKRSVCSDESNGPSNATIKCNEMSNAAIALSQAVRNQNLEKLGSAEQKKTSQATRTSHSRKQPSLREVSEQQQPGAKKTRLVINTANENRPGNIQEEFAPAQISRKAEVIECLTRVSKADVEPTQDQAFISTIWNESQTSQESFNTLDFDQARFQVHKKNPDTPELKSFRKPEAKLNLMQLRHPEETFKQLSLQDLEEPPIYNASIEVQSSRAPISQHVTSVQHKRQKPAQLDLQIIMDETDSLDGFIKKNASPQVTQEAIFSHSVFRPNNLKMQETEIEAVLQATMRNAQVAVSQQFRATQLASACKSRRDEMDLYSTQMMSSIGYQVAEDPSGVNLEQMREFMIDPGASKQIAYLAAKHLELKQTECQLSTEPDGLLKLKIHHKDLMYIPREILSDKLQFSEVQVLDVSNCSIVELEGKIFIELPNLRRMNAAKNQIRQLSVRIGQLEFLEVLILDNNCLEMIPMEIGNLQRTLRVLKLANNKLKSITNRIRELISLEVLHLQNNMLKTLPDNMELRNLQECMLSNNPLESFNLPLEKMPSLCRIGLDWFSYLLPPGPRVIEKSAEDFVAPEEIHQKQGKTPYASNKQIAESQSVLSISEDISERVINDRKQVKTKAAMAPPSANKQPMTRVKTYSAAVYQRSQSNSRNAPKAIDYFKELIVLMVLTKSRNFFTNQISNFQVLAQDVKVKQTSSEGRKVNNSSPRKLPQTLNLKLSPKSAGCAISFIPFAKHFLKLMNGVEGDGWINQVDDRGRTMLHYAALKGDTTVIKELLSNGADKTIVDKYEFDPYGYAMREDHFKVGMQILAHRRQALDLTKGSGTFGSHLHLAVAKLKPDHVEVMLSQRIDANLTEGIMKDTPCHVLVNQYNKNPIDARNILQQLVDSGADLNRQNKDGWTPVHCAIKKVSITALQGIIDVARQPDILIKPDLTRAGGLEGMTPLHLAAQSHSFEVLQMLFDENLDLFVTNQNDQRPYCSVNNNLLMLKLIKKEEKRITKTRFQKPGPRETAFTDKTLLRALLSPTNEEHRYTTFQETLRAVNAGMQQELLEDKVPDDQGIAPFAFTAEGHQQLLKSTVITVEDDFGDIRKRERSESLSRMDVDEETTHEQAKIVQLAGLLSSKKGVQLYKNPRREQMSPLIKPTSDFLMIETIEGLGGKLGNQTSFDQNRCLDTQENRYSDRGKIDIQIAAPPTLDWQVTSPSSMLRTSIKFQHSPRANERTPKRPTQFFQSPFIKLNKLNDQASVSAKHYGLTLKDPRSPDDDFVEGEENLMATLMSPAETKQIKVPIARLVAERVSSSLKSTFTNNDKPKLTASTQLKISQMETPVQSSQKTMAFNEERKNFLLQSAIIELKEKRRSKLELRLQQSIATEESLRQVRASYEVAQSRVSSELPENKALKLERKRSAEEIKQHIETYTTEQVESEKGFITSAKQRIAYLQQEHMPTWTGKQSPGSVAYEPLKQKQSHYFMMAKNELETDVAENTKLNKTTLTKQSRPADIKSQQQLQRRQVFKDPSLRAMNNTVTLGMSLNSEAAQNTTGRKSALPQFNNASKNLFDLKKPIGNLRLKLPMSTKGSGRNTPEKSLECKLNPRVTTVAIAKKNHRVHEKTPGGSKAQRDTITIQKVSKAKLNQKVKQPEKVNLFSSETLGCDVDSEADEALVDSRKIWVDNKTAHGPKEPPLDPDGLRATVVNDFSFLNIPLELQQTPLPKEYSRNSLPVKNTVTYNSQTMQGEDNSSEVIKEYALLSRKRPQKLESDNDLEQYLPSMEETKRASAVSQQSSYNNYSDRRRLARSPKDGQAYYMKKAKQLKIPDERVYDD